MWLRKVILVIIFVWHSAQSKHPAPFKIQMKNGNFFFDEGNGDIGVDVIDKGGDASCSEESGGAKLSDPALVNTLSLLDKTISDLGNDAGKKEEPSELDPWKERVKLNEMRRVLGDSRLVDAANVDDNDHKLSSKEIAHDHLIHSASSKKEKEESKITDTDLQKIREVIDREYGKSILLIPKHDLESFIHFVKEYSMNDLLRSSDTAEFKSADERSRLRNISRYPNRVLTQPRTRSDWQIPEENRQEILQEFVRFLDQKKGGKDSPEYDAGNNMRNGLSSLTESNNQMPISRTGFDTVVKNTACQDNNISLDAVKDFLDSLSEDKSQIKQSLLRWFEIDNPRHMHSNCRRSIKNAGSTSSPLKKEKKNRKFQQKETKAAYQRISRCDVPILGNRFQKLSKQAGRPRSHNLLFNSGPKRFGLDGSKYSNKIEETPCFGDEKRWLNEEGKVETRATRAAFIR